jgi:hypothetical protein
MKNSRRSVKLLKPIQSECGPLTFGQETGFGKIACPLPNFGALVYFTNASEPGKDSRN